jgi:hypothetical protein
MISPRTAVVPIGLSPPAVPHQLSIAFDSLLLREMSPSERSKVVAHLASLLTQAAGAATEEPDDDRL